MALAQKVGKSEGSVGHSDSNSVRILIMNTNGPNDGIGTAERRKKCIADVIRRQHPEIVLFQEFAWSGITGSTWTKTPIPEQYEFTGNKDASILHDNTSVILSLPSLSDLQRLLEEMIRKGELSGGFTPLPRMCVRLVERKGTPNLKFICVSWHGRYSGRKEESRAEEIKDLLLYLTRYSFNKRLPIVIAGDFNLRYETVRRYVEKPLVAYSYEPLARRTGNVIDFYIASESLKLDNIAPIDITAITNADRPQTVLDHDPVCASLNKPVPKESQKAQVSKKVARKTTAQKKLLSTIKKTVEGPMQTPRSQ